MGVVDCVWVLKVLLCCCVIFELLVEDFEIVLISFGGVVGFVWGKVDEGVVSGGHKIARDVGFRRDNGRQFCVDLHLRGEQKSFDKVLFDFLNVFIEYK